jgi:hypothetical protein
MARKRWLDLSKVNASLTPLIAGKNEKKVQVLAIVGDIGEEISAKLQKDMGFFRLGNVTNFDALISKRYTRKSTGKLALSMVPLDEIAAIFEGSEIKEMEIPDMMKMWSGINKSNLNAIYTEASSKKALRALDSYESIGLNDDGLEIYQTPTNERFYFPNQDDASEHLLFERKPSSYFLNYDLFKDTHINKAAIGLLREMEEGRLIDQDRLDMMIETSRNDLRVTSLQAALAQFKVSKAINAIVSADNYNIYDKAEISDLKLSELNMISTNLVESSRAQKHNITTPKLLTPAFSYMTRALLEATDEATGLTVVNSSGLGAVSFIPKEIPITLIGSADPITVTPFEDVNGKITTTIVNPNSSIRVRGKHVVGSCEIGILDAPEVINGLSISRRDHLQALNICRGLDDDAVAMIIINGDNLDELGRVSFESTEFHQLMYRTYNIVDIIDVAPHLVAASSENNNKRVYLVNGKRLIESTALAPLDLNVVYNTSDIVQLSRKFKSLFEAKSSQVLDKVLLQTTNSVSDLLQSYTSSHIESARFELNFAQAQYTALTNLAIPTPSAQPINFVNASREASIKLVRSVGNPDQFFLSEMKLTKEEAIAAWDAEQIDALTMGIWRVKNKLPFIQGDATGKGKGRVLAGFMHWCVINDIKPVFMTSSADLLSDIWRDVKDTGLDKTITPFFLAGTNIVDKSNGHILYDAHSIAEKRDNYIGVNSATIPENAVFTTYSQVNTLKRSTKKIKEIKNRFNSKANILNRLNDRAIWLANYLDGNDVMLIVDESHNVTSTTSNQARIFEYLKSKTKNPIIRSSATWAKDEGNIAQCEDLFPAEYTEEILKDMIRRGGTGAQEILASTLIAEGTMVRREHDYGQRKVEVYESEDYQRNRIATDALASIMQKARAYATAQFNAIKELTANQVKHKDIEEYSFASSFSLVSDAFTNAMRADEVARRTINMVNSNEKPIIGVDKTAETAVKYLYDLTKEQISDDEPVIFDDFPSLTSMLTRWVENEGSRKIRTTLPPSSHEIQLALKENRRPIPDVIIEKIHWRDEFPPASPQYQMLEELEQQVLQEIPNMPFLPLSPIDYVRTQMEAEGISATEVSGRTLEIGLTSDNRFEIRPRLQVTKAQAQFDFNSNAVDAIFVTRAGTEGISLHAQDSYLKYSPKAANKRNITLMGTFLYIVDEEQFFGRGERKGQSIPSRSSKITTGMPVEARMLALSERNRLKLSSATTGNSRSLRATNIIPNFLNSFGDQITAEYLFENQNILDLLGFEQHRKTSIIECGEQNEKSNNVRSLTGSVLGRMMLLSYDQQQSLLDDLSAYFNTKLALLQTKGIDPINTKILSGSVEILEEMVLFGDSKDHYISEFDRPVMGEVISVTSDPIVINPHTIEKEIDLSKRMLAKHDCKNGQLDSFVIDLITKKETILQGVLERHNVRQQSLQFSGYNTKSDNIFTTIDDAIKSTRLNDVKRTNNLIEQAIKLLRQVTIGDIINSPQYNSKLVITGVKLPIQQEHYTQAYRYRIVTSSTNGEIGKEYNLDSFEYLLGQDSSNYTEYKVGEFSMEHPICDEFEEISLDGVTSRHHILTGNMLEASRLNAEKNLGQQINIKDTKGNVYSAIKLRPEHTIQKLISLNFSANASSISIFNKYVKSNMGHGEIYTLVHDSDKTQETTIAIFLSSSGQFAIALPKTLAGMKDLDRNDPFDGLEIKKSNLDSRSNVHKRYQFSASSIDSVLRILNNHGFRLQISPERLVRMGKQVSGTANSASTQNLSFTELLNNTSHLTSQEEDEIQSELANSVPIEEPLDTEDQIKRMDAQDNVEQESSKLNDEEAELAAIFKM